MTYFVHFILEFTNCLLNKELLAMIITEVIQPTTRIYQLNQQLLVCESIMIYVLDYIFILILTILTKKKVLKILKRVPKYLMESV